MRIGLFTEGGCPYVGGDTGLRCDRLVRHESDRCALSRGRQQEDESRIPLPPRAGRVRTAPRWTTADGTTYGGHARRRFAECDGEAAVVRARPGAAPGPATGATGARSASDAPQVTGALDGGAPADQADRFGDAPHGLTPRTGPGRPGPREPLTSAGGAR